MKRESALYFIGEAKLNFKKTGFFLFLFITLSIIQNAFCSAAPDLTRRVMDNGLVVIVKEVKTTSMVSVLSLLDVGSASEGQMSGAGISHLVEHMLFKGAGDFGVGEIEQKIKSYGGSINGFTSYDFSGYQALVQDKYLGDTLKIIYSMLSQATFDPQEFSKEKEVIINEINMNSDEPGWQLQTLFFSTAYTTHPYRFPIIGKLPLFKKITWEQAVDFYHNNYLPNCAVLLVCGNVDTEKTLGKIEEIFKKWESNYSLVKPEIKEPKQLGLRRIDKPFKVKLAHISLGFHTVSLKEEDMYPLDVLASILGSKESSRLNQEVNKKQGLVYTIEAENFTPRDKGIFNIYAQTESAKVNPAISAILNEIEKIKTGKISEEELNKAKDEVLSNFLFGREKIESLSYRLAQDELLAHNPNFSQRYVEKIKEVTSEQLGAAAKKYFTSDNLTIATVFPEEGKETVSTPAQPLSQEEEMEKIILPSGLTVLLKENHALPIVSVSSYFLAGVRAENESNNGISNLTASMLLSGTKSKKALEISQAIENKGGSISTISGNNSIGVTLSLLKENLESALMVLADVLTNSTFPDDELKKEKEIVMASIKSEDDDVFRSASNLFKQTLYQKHPYRFSVLGKEKTVTNISRNDLADFYKRYINARNGVLVIFGDIDKKKTIAIVEKYFKNLNAAPFKPLEISPEPPGKGIKESSKTLTKEQAVVMLGFRTLSFDNNDRYALDVLSGIISGGGGKLFEEIRDNLGLSYTLGAYSIPGIEPGYYIFYVATTPENKEKVRGLLLQQIEKIRSGYLTEEDLRLAKNYLIAQNELALETNSALANQVALDQLYGLGFNRYKEYAQNINKVTLKDIKNAVDKYLNFNNAALTLVSPQ